MEICQNNYYHIYYRFKNSEVVFKSPVNYSYFLSKYRKNLGEKSTALAYCLMPAHFHFLAFIRTEKTNRINEAIGLMLSSYTKAIINDIIGIEVFFNCTQSQRQNVLSRMMAC